MLSSDLLFLAKVDGSDGWWNERKERQRLPTSHWNREVWGGGLTSGTKYKKGENMMKNIFFYPPPKKGDEKTVKNI